jgi:hypothetical protein
VLLLLAGAAWTGQENIARPNPAASAAAFHMVLFGGIGFLMAGPFFRGVARCSSRLLHPGD